MISRYSLIYFGRRSTVWQERTVSFCLSAHELKNRTGRTLSAGQAACLENLGVAYVRRPDGSLGVFRNVIEQRLAELWREYCDQLDAYKDALEAFEHRMTSMP